MRSLLSLAGRHETIGAHERAQRFGHDHAAVLLLELLEDREPGAADREARAVQRAPGEAWPWARAVANLGASGNSPNQEQLEISRYAFCDGSQTSRS